MKKLIFAISLFSVVLFSACAGVPQVEIDAANAAVKDAKTAGADLYVPADYKAVVDSLASATIKVETAKSSWFKTYSDAKYALAFVTKMAVDVKVKSEARKVEVKTETDALITDVKALIIDDKALLAKAPKGKDGKAALQAISTELSVVETTVTESEALLATDLFTANSKMITAKDKATAIKTELETATDKTALTKAINKK